MMNGVEVEVAKDGPGFSLWLFPDTTNVHVWREDTKSDVEKLSLMQQTGHVRRFDFTAGEKFKVAWEGCDLIYSDKIKNTFVRYDLVCLVQTQETASDPITRLYKGYICEEVLPMKNFSNNVITVTEVLPDPEEEQVIELADIVPPASPVTE